MGRPSDGTAKLGRPSIFSDELALTICDRIAKGESVRTICLDDDMPSGATVFKWLADPAMATFTEQYTRAREAQADFYAESIIQIADDGRNDTYLDENGNQRTDQDVIARSRLRVDARKWYASKLAPKKYGDKLEHSGPGADGALVVEITRFGTKSD